MSISGTFAAMTATAQPMAAKPAPASAHGDMTPPANNWTVPPASTGGGYPDAQAEQVQMSGRGIQLDIGHRWGHRATAAIRNARKPFVTQGGAQEASAAAHGDSTAGYYQGHMYDPGPQQFAGSRYEVVPSNVRAIPSFAARTVIHGRPGGQHVDGTGGDWAPTGFPTGEAGRFAIARYSSPTLGAMYSKNALRGVLPNTISTPYNQPGLVGAAGTKSSGIPSNQRFLGSVFTTPALFRSPASMSDAMIAAAPPTEILSDTMGVGM